MHTNTASVAILRNPSRSKIIPQKKYSNHGEPRLWSNNRYPFIMIFLDTEYYYVLSYATNLIPLSVFKPPLIS